MQQVLGGNITTKQAKRNDLCQNRPFLAMREVQYKVYKAVMSPYISILLEFHWKISEIQIQANRLEWSRQKKPSVRKVSTLSLSVPSEGGKNKIY